MCHSKHIMDENVWIQDRNEWGVFEKQDAIAKG